MYEYWVTEEYWAHIYTPNQQMKMLNGASADGWDLVSVTNDGRYILRRKREVGE